MRFVGLDLAWSSRNPSGAVALIRAEGASWTPAGWSADLQSDEEIVAFITEAVGEGPGLVAIDAPLVVPNEAGTRPCDLALSRVYRKAEAGALPANRRRLGPVVRGEEIVRKLGHHGFVHSPHVERRRPVRQVVEVYPHPAMVELFGLTKTLKYKARKGCSLENRRQELARYIELLRSLAKRDPPLQAKELLSGISVSGLRGGTLKRVEDLLDACFCAYIALYIWWHGKRGYRCFGDLKRGYILVPVKTPSTPAVPG